MASNAKKPKRLTKYSASYKKDYPFIRKCSSAVADHIYKFNCSVCNINISCAHGGITDVKNHIATKGHKDAHSNLQSKLFLYLH